MLTNTKCEFWVIMNDHTPAFPGPSGLPFLIDDPKTKQFRFEITNPFDGRVKTYQFAATAQAEIERLRKYPDLGNDLKNAYPFKVECSVRIASLAESLGTSNNMPPMNYKLSIPKSKPLGPGMTWDELKRTLPSFKKIRIKHIDKDDAVKTLNVDVSQFVPWILKKETLKDWPWKDKIKYMVFLGSECRFIEDLSSERLIPSSVIVEEHEYQRLRKVYEKFQQNPSDFIVKGDDT